MVIAVEIRATLSRSLCVWPGAARALLASFALALVATGAGAQPFLLATSPGAGDVVALDLTGGGTAGTFAAGAMPAGAALSADGTRLYVADAGAGELLAIDPAGGPVGSVAVGAGPAGVALCTGGARLAVALAQDDAVAVVDTATLGVVATLPAGDQPLAVACAGGFLAVANYGSATLAVFDAVTLAPLGTATVGGFPAGVAIGGDRAWVTSLFDSTVTVVALPDVTVDDTVPVGSAPRGIAISGGRVFVANVNDATLTVLDTLTALVVATVPLPTPGPTDLLAQGDLFVAHLGEPAVTVVSTAALTVTATLDAPTGLLALGGVTELGIAPAAIPAVGPIGLVVLAVALVTLALRWRVGAAVVLLVALGGGATAARAQVVYSDSEFADSDWELFTGADPGQSASQSAFAGNPPPSRAMVHFHLPGESILVIHRWLAASHDPATAGAVTGIDVAWDRQAGGVDCPPPEAVTEAFVVFQADVAYTADEEVFSHAEWATTGATGLQPTDFSDGSGGTPDFSAAGGALSFGYLRSTVTTVEDPPHVICHGIDNLVVTVSTEEPGPPGETVIGLEPTDYFPLEGDDLVVSATRTGDLTGEASVQVILSNPLGPGPDRTITWPAGTGGEATATFLAAELGEGLDVRTLRLLNASPGAVIDPERDSGMVYVANSPLAGLWAALGVLLASWDLAGLLLLGGLALFAAARRRGQQQAGGAAGEGAVEVSIDGGGAAELRGRRPQFPALGGELRRQHGEDRQPREPVAAQRRGATGGEQAVEQSGEPGHGGGAWREQEHAERGPEARGERGGHPPVRAELAGHHGSDQREAGEVPRQVRAARMHEMGGQQAPGLAVAHRPARVSEPREVLPPAGGHQQAGGGEDGEGERAPHGAGGSSHSWPLPRPARGGGAPARVRWRTASWLLLAAPGLLASWGCVETRGDEIVPKFAASGFNERISSDLHGLSPNELSADLDYGLFRDGTLDPDGPEGPRAGGLISEIYPVPAGDARGPGNLVQTPCLFVGRDAKGGDELRLSWEVTGRVDLQQSTGEFWQRLTEGYEWVGLCTMISSPTSRLIAEDPRPGAPRPEPDGFLAASQVPWCAGARSGNIAFTASDEPDNLRNQPWPCRFADVMTVDLQLFGAIDVDPDAACPAERFAAFGSPVGLSGCMTGGGHESACGLGCGLEPTRDASYRVRIDPDPIGLPAAEHWLRPDVLVVDGQRTMVRPMTPPPMGSVHHSWQTEVTRLGGEAEGPVQWAENFSPTVRVDTVQIVSRGESEGDEQVETPTDELLIVEVPRSAGSIPPLECRGAAGPDGFTFSIADCAARSDYPEVLDALTPTYLVADLHLEDPVELPITWRAELGRLDPTRRAFVKFGLRAQTMGAALRVSPAVDFGRLPDTDYRQGVVELENVGGEVVEITDVELVPGQWQPQDFAFFVLGDPIPMPLPVEAKPAGDGSVTLQLGDLGEAPLLSLNELGGGDVMVGLGDPAAPPGQPQPMTLYGEGATLRGYFLTRDDPAATFVPPSSSDPRPFVVPAYVELTPPFLLRPGERRSIAVEARPSAHGLRRATLRVQGAPASDPRQVLDVRSQLMVEVVSGPLLRWAPLSLLVSRGTGGSEPPDRTVVVFNAGHVDLTVHDIALTGAGAARFVAGTDRGTLGPFVLPPGDFTDVAVEYLPECDGTYGTATSMLDHEATVVVTTNDGTARIEVGGASQGFCESP